MRAGSRLLQGAAVVSALAVASATTSAYAERRPTLNLQGVTGLIDMPSGEAQPDGEFNVTFSGFGPVMRSTLTFQITPRIQGSFRYAGTKGLLMPPSFGPDDTYWDRAFDLRFLLLRESRYLPAVTLGFQDFVGTGINSAEFVAATKSFGPEGRVKVTGGIGWGRMGSYNDLGSPFGDRPGVDDPNAGTINSSAWFRGPAAPFGGIEWHVNDRLGLKAEYSSDAYALEDERSGILNRRSPINFGAEYQVTDGFRLGAYYLYGSEVGLMAQFTMNPKRRPTGGIAGPGPRPVEPRPDRRTNPDAWSTAWTAQADGPQLLRRNIARRLRDDGLNVESLAVTADRAELRLRNPDYDSTGQMYGRVARAMAASLPASVEYFDIVPEVNGLPASRVTLRRSDIEALEFAPDNASRIGERAVISDAGPRPADAVMAGDAYPRLDWSIGPYVRHRMFGVKDPFYVDVGVGFSAHYHIAPGLFLSGSVTQKIVGNLDTPGLPNTSPLPHVRTDLARYDRVGKPVLGTLTATWNARPGANLYSRVTAGYLERMFGGVSAELLWKPVDSRFALGAEINYVKQRDFRQGFGFQDYDVVTGHVSAYYEWGNGYHTQLDVGRYLAGDVGATLSIDREFANGWRVGAFATKTDVSSADFGPGSFDKGIRVTIPVNWSTGRTTRSAYGLTIRPFTRDGGARLDVDGRLYEMVRGYHEPQVDNHWGRFWR